MDRIQVTVISASGNVENSTRKRTGRTREGLEKGPAQSAKQRDGAEKAEVKGTHHTRTRVERRVDLSPTVMEETTSGKWMVGDRKKGSRTAQV